MPFQQNTPINMATVRSYDIFIPPTPLSALLPAIIAKNKLKCSAHPLMLT
jgi:hypothetical protein